MLLKAARTDESLECRQAALRGYVRLAARAPGLKPGARNLLLVRAVTAVTGTAEKKALIAALGDYPVHSLMAVRSLLDDETVAGEARAAIVRIEASRRRAGFKATASTNQGAAKNAIDNRPGSGWDTGTPMQPGTWLTVDLGDVYQVRGLVLDAGPIAGRHPKAYEVYVTAEEGAWGSPATAGVGEGRKTEIEFDDPLPARFIRVVQTGESDVHPWAVHDLRIRYE
jgi:hypothetical protein